MAQAVEDGEDRFAGVVGEEGDRLKQRGQIAGGATFWRLNPTDYGPLNALARRQVNAHLIEQH